MNTEKTLGQTNKKHALQDVVKIVQQYRRVAITCFEQDHTCCHRNDVAKAIADKHKNNHSAFVKMSQDKKILVAV